MVEVNEADLYLSEIDFERYLSREACRRCGADSCKALVEKLRRGEVAGEGDLGRSEGDPFHELPRGLPHNAEPV